MRIHHEIINTQPQVGGANHCLLLRFDKTFKPPSTHYYSPAACHIGGNNAQQEVGRNTPSPFAVQDTDQYLLRFNDKHATPNHPL